MGCKKKNDTMKRLFEYQEELYKDKTEQSDFIGNVSLWLQRQKVIIIDGAWIGIKKIDHSPVTLAEVLGTSTIELPPHYGIYLSQEEILKRPKYSWFSRMSTEQILESPFFFSKKVQSI
jgi:hypothetical protein